jgi:hypothetical protein
MGTAARIGRYLLLAPLLMGGCPEEMKEVPTTALPKGIEWALSDTKHLRDSSSIGQIYLVETDNSGRALSRRPLTNETIFIDPCLPYLDKQLADQVRAKQVPDAHLVLSTESATPKREVVLSAQAKAPSLITTNVEAQALWLLRNSTAFETKGEVSAPVPVTGSVKGGVENITVTLMAFVSSYRLAASDDYVECRKAAVFADKGRESRKAQIASFRSQMSDPTHAIRYEIGLSAIYGGLVGSTLSSVQVHAGLDANATIETVKATFKVNLTTDKISMDYQQWGGLVENAELDRIFKERILKREPSGLLQDFRQAVARNSVIGIEYQQIADPDRQDTTK